MSFTTLKMGLTTPKTLAQLTVDELNTLGEQGETVLITDISNDVRHELPLLPGGWATRYVGATEDGATGKLVLIPTCRYTQQLWNDGQIKLAMRAGLSRTQAQAWFSADIRNKHELLPLLDTVLNCHEDDLYHTYGHRNRGEVVRGYLDYRFEFTKPEYLQWRARTQITEPRHPRRLVDFANLLRIMIQDTELDPRPVIGGNEPEPVTADTRPWE